MKRVIVSAILPALVGAALAGLVSVGDLAALCSFGDPEVCLFSDPGPSGAPVCTMYDGGMKVVYEGGCEICIDCEVPILPQP